MMNLLASLRRQAYTRVPPDWDEEEKDQPYENTTMKPLIPRLLKGVTICLVALSGFYVGRWSRACAEPGLERVLGREWTFFFQQFGLGET